jgi:hypothetical protein
MGESEYGGKIIYFRKASLMISKKNRRIIPKPIWILRGINISFETIPCNKASIEKSNIK